MFRGPIAVSLSLAKIPDVAASDFACRRNARSLPQAIHNAGHAVHMLESKRVSPGNQFILPQYCRSVPAVRATWAKLNRDARRYSA
jgi:hypothetical protein